MSIFRRSHRRSNSSGDVFDIESLQIQKLTDNTDTKPMKTETQPEYAATSQSKSAAKKVLGRFSLSSSKPSPSFKVTQSYKEVISKPSIVEFRQSEEFSAHNLDPVYESTSSHKSQWFSLGWKHHKTPKKSPQIHTSRKTPLVHIPESNAAPSFVSRTEAQSNSRVKSMEDLYEEAQPEVVRVLNQPFADVSERYEIGPELGTGTFGIVRKCWDRRTGASLAVKTVVKSNLLFDSDFEDLRMEVKTLTAVRNHHHVVRLEDVYEDEKSVHLIMELCEGGDLFHRIRQKKRFSESSAARVILALSEAVDHCWSRGVMHRDLKPENILLAGDSDWDIRVADFGKACFAKPGEKKTDIVGTPFYLPPEVLSGSYGLEADMWCVGVVLFILLSGKPPFWAREKDEIFDLIEKGDYDCRTGVWTDISPAAKDLVKKMLTRDARKRIKPGKVKDHPWILHHSLNFDSGPIITATPLENPPDSDLYQTPVPPPTYRPTLVKDVRNFTEVSPREKAAPASASSASSSSSYKNKHRKSLSVSPSAQSSNYAVVNSRSQSSSPSTSPDGSGAPSRNPKANFYPKGLFMPPKSPSKKTPVLQSARRLSGRYSYSAPQSPMELKPKRPLPVMAEDLSVDELLVLLMKKLEKEKKGKEGDVGVSNDEEEPNSANILSDISQRLDRIGGARAHLT